jgi:hypothetical protein
MKVGDEIEVIDHRAIGPFPVHGIILELDEHPLGASYAKIQILGAAISSVHFWVNLRLAKVVKEA